MRRKTKVVISSATLLTVGLAAIGVGFVFGNSVDYGVKDVDDPTLQNTLLENTENKSVEQLISERNLKDILYISAYTLDKQDNFSVVSSGIADAKAIGVSSKQDIKTYKIVNEKNDEYGKEYFFQTQTFSTWVKQVEQRYVNDSTFLYRRNDKTSNIDDVSFNNVSINEMQGKRAKDVTEENPNLYFYDRYGQIPDGLTTFILNDYTVKNSSLISESNNLYTIKYELNVDNSTEQVRNAAEKYKRDVSIMADAKGYPVYNYISIDLTINENFEVQSIFTREVYDIVTRGVTATTTSESTFDFSYSDSYINIPDYDVFKPHFGSAENATGGTDTKKESALDYLAPAGANLTNKDKIIVKASLFEGERKIPLYASVKLNKDNFQNSDIELVLGDPSKDYLCLKFADESYLKLGNIFIKTTRSELLNLINSLIDINSLLGSFSSFNPEQIPGLVDLLNNATIAKDEASKVLSITLDMDKFLGGSSFNGLTGAANILIKNYDTKPEISAITSNSLDLGIPFLNGLSVDVNLLDKEESSALPVLDFNQAVKINNLDSLGNFLKNILKDKSLGGEVNFKENIGNLFVEVNGTYQLSFKDDIKVEANLIINLLGLKTKVDLYYADRKLYLNIDNKIKSIINIDNLNAFNVNLTKSDDVINQLISKYTTIVNDIVSSIREISNSIMEANFNKLLSALVAITRPVSEVNSSTVFNIALGSLDLGFHLNTDSILLQSNAIPFSISLKNSNKDIFIPNFGNDCISEEDLSTLVKNILKIVDNKKVSLDLTLNQLVNKQQVKLKGQANIDLTDIYNPRVEILLDSSLYGLNNQIRLILNANELYASIDNTSLYLTIGQLKSLVQTFNIEKVLSLLGLNLNFRTLDNILNLQDLINNFVTKLSNDEVSSFLEFFNFVGLNKTEQGLSLNFNIASYDFSLDLNNNGSIDLYSKKIGLVSSLTSSKDISVSDIPLTSYDFDYDKLVKLVNLANAILENNKVNIDFSLIYGKADVSGNLLLDLNSALNFQLNLRVSYDNVFVTAKLIKKGNTLYLDLGNVKINIQTTDIVKLLKTIEKTLGSEIKIDKEKLYDALLAISDGSNLTEVIKAFVNLFGSFQSKTTPDLSSLNVSDILSRVTLANNSLGFSLDNLLNNLSGTINLRSTEDSLETFINSSKDINFEQLNILVENILKSYQVLSKKDSFSLGIALDLLDNSNSLLSIKDSYIRLMTIDKSKGFSLDNLGVEANLVLDNLGSVHKIKVIYINKTLYVEYNDNLKFYIEEAKLISVINNVLKIVKGDYDSLVTNSTSIDFDSLMSLFSSENNHINLNNLLNNLSITKESVELGLNFNNNIVPLTLGFKDNVINSLSLSSLSLNETKSLSANISLNDEEFTISAPSIENYLYFGTFDNLLVSFVKTAKTRNFEISGTLSFTLDLGIAKITNTPKINIKIKLDDNFLPTVNVRLDFEETKIALNYPVMKGTLNLWYIPKTSESDTVGGNIYISRYWEYKNWLGKKVSGTEYFTFDNDNGKYFLNEKELSKDDYMGELVIMILACDSSFYGPIIKAAVNGSSTDINTKADFSKVIGDYKFNSTENLEQHNFVFNLKEVIDIIDDNLQVSLTANKVGDDYLISHLDVSGKMLSSWAIISLSGDLVNIGEELTLNFPSNIGKTGW